MPKAVRRWTLAPARLRHGSGEQSWRAQSAFGVQVTLGPGFTSAGFTCGRAGYHGDVYDWTPGLRLGVGFVWEGLTLRSTTGPRGLLGVGGRQLAPGFRCGPGFTGGPAVTSVQGVTGPGAYLVFTSGPSLCLSPWLLDFYQGPPVGHPILLG